MWYVFEGSLEPWNPKPIPKLWDLGQTKAPVGKITVDNMYNIYIYTGKNCMCVYTLKNNVYIYVIMFLFIPTTTVLLQALFCTCSCDHNRMLFPAPRHSTGYTRRLTHIQGDDLLHQAWFSSCWDHVNLLSKLWVFPKIMVPPNHPF